MTHQAESTSRYADPIPEDHLIHDLEEYLATHPGVHPIFTGTFDPAHIQHVAPLLYSQNRLIQDGVQNPWIILPHSLNKGKTPTGTLEQRRRWIYEDVNFFAPQIAHHVRICLDCSTPEQRYLYDMREEFQRQLLRIAGADKGKISGGWVKSFKVPRDIPMSSSHLRELFRITQSIRPEVHAAVAPRVLAEIQDFGYYRE
jgi:hypothetical protein